MSDLVRTHTDWFSRVVRIFYLAECLKYLELGYTGNPITCILVLKRGYGHNSPIL